MQPFVTQDQSGLAGGITGASGALAQALQQRGQQQQQQQQQQQLEDKHQTILQSTLGTLTEESSPMDVLKANLSATAQGVPPEKMKALNSSYQAYLSAIKKPDPSQGPQTVFQKKLDEAKAKDVIEHIQGGSKNILNDNLNYLEENMGKVGRQKAITGGGLGAVGGGEYGPFQSSTFSEYESRGKLILDGVIKIYNKAGALPTNKLNWVDKKFSISPYDTQEVIKGKLNSLRSISNDGAAYDEEMGKLIEKYGENIPNSEYLNIQRKMAKTLEKYGGPEDSSEQQVGSPEQGKVVNKLPSEGVKKGATATDTDTGQKFIYNGNRWVKQK